MTDFAVTASTILKEIGGCLERVSPQSIDRAVQEITNARRVFAAGAGRSGVAIRGFTNRVMHLGKIVHLVGDITTPSIATGDLLIIGSGSGRTDSLVAMASKAKKIGARLLLITIDPKSPIGEFADWRLRIDRDQ